MANYYENIVVANGGIVGRCPECRRKKGESTPTLLRFVTETRNLAGDEKMKDTFTYKLCDECADAELREFEAGGANCLDGRRTLL